MKGTQRKYQVPSISVLGPIPFAQADSARGLWGISFLFAAALNLQASSVKIGGMGASS